MSAAIEPSSPRHSPEAAFARQTQKLVRDLMRPNAVIFWADMLVTSMIGYAALAIYMTAPAWSLVQMIAYLVAGFALYRALMFTHELAHLPTGRFQGFRIVWNVLVGVPLMTPSFLYAEHRTHHVNHSYGTQGDAEYVPIGRGPVRLLVLFVLQGLLMPVLAVIRFGLLAPLSLFSRRLRTWVWQRASGLTQNNQHFRRPPARGKRALYWRMQEAGCFLVCATVATLLLMGIIDLVFIGKLYLLFAFVTSVSYLRALGSHLYFNEGGPMSYLEQMFDSTTIPGNPLLTELWAPLGQRYHALHHLFPSIPYHSLGTAHRRLMQQLPEDSPYRQTIRRSLFHALSDIWRRADKTYAEQGGETRAA